MVPVPVPYGTERSLFSERIKDNVGEGNGTHLRHSEININIGTDSSIAFLGSFLQFFTLMMRSVNNAYRYGTYYTVYTNTNPDRNKWHVKKLRPYITSFQQMVPVR